MDNTEIKEGESESKSEVQEQGLDDWKGLLEDKKLGQQEIDLCLKKKQSSGVLKKRVNILVIFQDLYVDMSKDNIDI